MKLKYPKLMLFLLSLVFAYFLFSWQTFLPIHNFMISLGYIGIFLAGIFFAYGFTAAPATALLLILAKNQNIISAGLIAGLGALVGDLFIFSLIRYSMADELRKLSKEKFVKYVNGKIPFKHYLIPVIAGFIIASPLPDEIGVTMLAASHRISMKLFSLLSYTLNTLGILVILIIGNSI